MASAATRARSNTSSSTNPGPRRKSRASTASAHSITTQPARHYPHESDPPLQLFPVHNIQSQTVQYTPEEMITRSEHQLINPNSQYAIDPSLQIHPAHVRAMSVDRSFSGPLATARPPITQYNSFNGQESQMIESVADEAQDDPAAGEGKKKKGSASSIANDLELRRLFRENQGRLLKDVAAQVLANERGPKSEKTKQIFAMLWLASVCKKSSSSVPRNRVFSYYATRCGTERVPPLNPASFGKLVRIIFPGIQTRRLGMRGESKYHYVDLSLIEDQPDGHGNERSQGVKVFDGSTDKSFLRRPRSQLPADTAVFPSPDLPFNSTFSNSDSHQSVAPASLYLDPTAPDIQEGPSCANMVRRELKFPTCNELSYSEDEPISLPSISNYVPAGTDPDASNALIALYRSHCVSVIDCFRFCKEKMLWHHFTSFHGTLTVPVQKLLAHPDIAPWIKACDWLMYQKMIRFVAPLALQVVPVRVIETFRAISTKLGPHVTATFQNHPQHVRDAKLGPAIIFAGLLDRLLRVNATAHAAANMLTNDANRDQMWHDWVLHVKPIRVVESSLPGCGYTRVVQILTKEVRELLGPLRTTAYVDSNSLFADHGDHGSTASQHGLPELDDSSTEGVLDRWTNFLNNLPSRFPGVDARQLLHCVGEVGAAALRDITMAQALSFGSWWITKVWVDEMLLWLAEKGGFMEYSSNSMAMRGQADMALDPRFGMDETSETFGASRPRTAASESVDGPSRYGSIDIGSRFQRDESRAASAPQSQYRHSGIPNAGSLNPQQELTSTHRQQVKAQQIVLPKENDYQEHTKPSGFPLADNTQVFSDKRITAVKETEMNHDDSGIGMEMEHEELRMTNYDGFVDLGVNNASDPTDVVVC